MRKQYRQMVDTSTYTGRESRGVSMTVPDKAMTPRQIYEKYGNGEPLPALRKEGVFHGDVFVPDMEKLDFVDRLRYLDAVTSHAKELRSEVSHKMAEEKRNKAISDAAALRKKEEELLERLRRKGEASEKSTNHS